MNRSGPVVHGFGWFTTGSVATPKARMRRTSAVPESPHLLVAKIQAERRAEAIKRGEYLEHQLCNGA